MSSEEQSLDNDSPKFILKSKAMKPTEKVFAYDLGPKQSQMVWKAVHSPLLAIQNQKNSSNDVSETEILSILGDVDRSESYLNSFLHVNFDWDRSCMSSNLQTDLSEEERRDYWMMPEDWEESDIDSIIDMTYIS